MKAETAEKGTILVVDDNPTNLHILLDYLNEMGFETLVARSGEGALRQLGYAKPDLILLDIMMPGIDGFETCRRLKENPETREIPVIFITALTETADKIKGFELGAVDYITKPFHQKEVLARLNTQLTIQRQKRELQDLNAVKDRFLSILAHDLKNVFDTMVGPSRLLADSLTIFKEKEIRSIAQRLHRSAQDSLGMVEKIIDWANIRRGTIQPQPRTFDLCPAAQESMDRYRENAERKHIDYRNDVPPETMVYADPDMASTVLQNLISNAVKFTRNQGRVAVSARSGEGFREISVSDTGVGMGAKNLGNLFRIDKPYKKAGITGKEGAHLGLIICKEFVELNGGQLHVESELGVGTTVRFTLPEGFSVTDAGA